MRSHTPVFLLTCQTIQHVLASSIINVKNTTSLGPQLSPDVTDVSRDGGYSALINGNIVFFYDDTECFDSEGDQLSFVSNTAAYASKPNTNILEVEDFGVVDLGTDTDGSRKRAILADSSVETGGWIPFSDDELHFNKQKKGKERVAIWPGTSPTSISTIQAFLFAPLVYVDSKPQDPSKEYQARGMTLITITAPDTGPVPVRKGDLIIPGTEVAYGGFSTVIGRKSTNDQSDRDKGDLDTYLLGMTESGLQLARIGINDVKNFDKFTFWDPVKAAFTGHSPKTNVKNPSQVYLPGTYSSGSVFYSPYFHTFLMIYFNKMTDSTFYIRYLDINDPTREDKTWVQGGKKGKGVEAEDVEALVFYKWSDEETLYISKPGPGGFNYAGIAHPEYFNRQYFAPSLYPDGTSNKDCRNDWYGADVISESTAGGDGKSLLLSWTSQKVGGKDAGIYDIEFAVIEFGTIPDGQGFPDPASNNGGSSKSPTSLLGSASPSSTSTSASSSGKAKTSTAAALGSTTSLFVRGSLSSWVNLLTAVWFLIEWHSRRGAVWIV